MNKTAKITVLGLMGNSVFLRVPHFHSSGETLRATALYMEPGGKGCNQAVSAARLGAQVTFFSCMGEDNTAEDCLAFMKSEGVSCYTEFVKETPSPYACILTDDTGDTRVTVHSGSALHMSSAFVESHQEIIANTDILLLNNECPLEANMAALEIALQNNAVTVLNPAPFLLLPREYLASFSIVTPNRYEAAMLCGLPSESSAGTLLQGLLSLGIHCPIITLGSEGAVIWDGEKEVLCPSSRVTAKDTTGAGDCFNGALCYGIATGLSIEESAKFAVKAASFSVTRSFVMPSLPYWKDLDN